MKTAFVTGISGQDGAYLADLLLKKKYKVIGITRSYNANTQDKLKYLQISDDVIIEQCDLLNISDIQVLINKYRPTEIYNLAAQSSVALSFKEPTTTIHFNVISVINLLESIRTTFPEIRFYQASSSEMYGKVESLPVKVETSMHPLSPYAISKASAFWIVQNYRESYSLFSCNGVLFNHESYLRDPGFFVKKVIHQSVKNRKNPDWKLRVGNVDIMRDFGYSPDYVEAMWLMLQNQEAKDYIICSGTSISLRSIIEYVFAKLDISLDNLIIDKDLYRPTDIENIYGDHIKAREELGWNYRKGFYEILDVLIEEEVKAFN